MDLRNKLDRVTMVGGIVVGLIGGILGFVYLPVPEQSMGLLERILLGTGAGAVCTVYFWYKILSGSLAEQDEAEAASFRFVGDHVPLVTSRKVSLGGQLGRTRQVIGLYPEHLVLVSVEHSVVVDIRHNKYM